MSEPLRVLILGANGRLGRALQRVYARGPFAVTAWGRADLDLTDSDAIPGALDRIPFDVLVNAAGLTSVDGCETRRQEAHSSNAVAPGLIAAHCHRHGRRMIHISSDYVFPGTEPTLRKESDPVGPRNYYGQTKLDGEYAALAANPSALVVRVSWLFGPDKESFPDMILRTAMAQPTVSAVNDKWSSPSYADDLADWFQTLITRHPDASGILHLSNQGAPSWQQYGQATLDIAAHLGLPLQARTVTGHTMHGFAPFVATRPPFTALDTSKFQALTGIQPRPWQDALEDYLKTKWLPTAP
jgi:dTDP-4-dehydrorhamnose reductase